MRIHFIVLLSIIFLLGCNNDKPASTELKGNLIDNTEKIDTKIEETTLQKDTTATKSNSAEPVEKVKIETTENQAHYICPNSCPEGKSDKPDSCKSCNMELIENPDYLSE